MGGTRQALVPLQRVDGAAEASSTGGAAAGVGPAVTAVGGMIGGLLRHVVRVVEAMPSGLVVAEKRHYSFCRWSCSERIVLWSS